MIAFALAVAGATLGAGLAAAVLLRRLRTLRLRLAALGLVAVLLPLAAVLLSGVAMFDSEHDLTILAVAAASSTAALAASFALGESILRPVERIRDASSALADGDLAARAPEGGPVELAELADSFNEMAENLEGLFDARRQLVAWASHDLRTPLASMQAMLEALEDGIAEPQTYLPAMREQVRTLNLLVDDLFELARIDAGVLTLEVRELPLEPLVNSCLRGLEAEAAARHITLRAVPGGADARVRAAPDKVERVLYNLLANALRHTPSDGSVAVVLEPLAGEVCVTVEDTGEGLSTEAVRRMFDRFWRGDRARSRERGGAGLGLAIARGLVEAHGGRIWAESRPGGGARVSFTLPRSPA
ncbi:MAG TPA: HAMP domain-containing sensor histidine kinase [Gaiellaceae bacterium]|nr:HAMP domain-containing sensor histidine kinase [Gaiellaceae bacterium]